MRKLKVVIYIPMFVVSFSMFVCSFGLYRVHPQLLEVSHFNLKPREKVLTNFRYQSSNHLMLCTGIQKGSSIRSLGFNTSCMKRTFEYDISKRPTLNPLKFESVNALDVTGLAKVKEQYYTGQQQLYKPEDTWKTTKYCTLD